MSEEIEEIEEIIILEKEEEFRKFVLQSPKENIPDLVNPESINIKIFKVADSVYVSIIYGLNPEIFFLYTISNEKGETLSVHVIKHDQPEFINLIGKSFKDLVRSILQEY